MGIKVDAHDEELRKFGAEGAAPLPVPNDQGYVEHEGARIWYSTHGSGSPVAVPSVHKKSLRAVQLFLLLRCHATQQRDNVGMWQTESREVRHILWHTPVD
jgi:hypothetical protein